VTSSPLEPLPPVGLERVELVCVPMTVATPVPTASGFEAVRTVLLVHVVTDGAEGWAECAVEPLPGYDAESTASARAALVDHLLPAVAGRTVDGLGLAQRLDHVPGHHQAKAAVELAVLDVQLRLAGRSLASWLGATASAVPAGAAVSAYTHDHVDEATRAVALGAARVRVKVGPGRAAQPLAALHDHLGPDVLLQADANGSFSLDEPDHLAELHRLDDVGLACLEQPLAPDDLAGHARLAERLRTPICLDEPLTSFDAVERSVVAGACEVVCLKPGRVGGWPEARRIHDRCVELGVPLWVGGMHETAIGRAANLALAALPGMALPMDLDPRGRYEPDLAHGRRPGADGLVPVPDGPGTGAAPDPSRLAGTEVLVVRRDR
jgi:O-succinylbenzoate synthase